MPIELGLSHDEAVKESRMELVPDDNYEFAIKEVREGNTQEGRPRLSWFLQIINHATLSNRTIIYNTPIPWVTPGGERDLSGLGFLIAMCDGVGLPWAGSSLNKESYYGRTGFMRVGHRARRDNPETQDNTVKILKRVVR